MRAQLSTLVAITSLVWLGACASVDAQELALAIESECDEAALTSEIEAALERPLSDGATVLEAHVVLRRERSRVRVVINLARAGAQSERVIEARDCAGAVRATGLVLALALDAEREVEGDDSEVAVAVAVAVEVEVAGESEVAVEAEAEAAVEGEAEAESEGEAESELEGDSASDVVRDDETDREIDGERSDPRVTLLASGVVDLGSLPDPAGGARVGFGFALFDRVLRIELDATYLASTRVRSALPGANVDVVLAYATLRVGALAPVIGPLAIGGALELVIGVEGGTGVGVRVQQAGTAWLPWVAARAALLVEVVMLGPVAVRVSGAFGIPIAAPVFSVVGVDGVRAAAEVVGEGAASIVVELS